MPSGSPATLPAAMNANESLESIGALWALTRASLVKHIRPSLDCGFNAAHGTPQFGSNNAWVLLCALVLYPFLPSLTPKWLRLLGVPEAAAC
jgi:hypothetical protein